MDMELSEVERAAIQTIVDGEKAWSRMADLAKAGHSLDTIADLILRKILDPWAHPDDGESVTLAPFGAYLWKAHKAEELELAERPCTILRQKQHQGEVIDIRISERVNFWVEGGKPDPGKLFRRHVENYGLIASIVRDRASGPEFLVDEDTGKTVELFMGLFNGTKVKGIPVRVCPKLKGAKKKAKGKGKQAKAKRRRAG